MNKTVTSMPATAVVAGATGMIGRELVRLLLADPRYAKVVVLTRRAGSFAGQPKLEERVVDFDRLADAFSGDAGEPLRDAIVFCTLGTTIRTAGSQEAFRRVDYEYPLELGRLAASGGASQLLIVTAMGANAGSRVFYTRVKGEVERALQALALPRLHIFRPSLLLGERQEVRLGERIAASLAPILSFALRGPLRKYRPIAGQAVAMGMLAAAASPGSPAAAGTETIVYESDRIADLALAYGQKPDLGYHARVRYFFVMLKCGGVARLHRSTRRVPAICVGNSSIASINSPLLRHCGGNSSMESSNSPLLRHCGGSSSIPSINSPHLRHCVGNNTIASINSPCPR